MKQRYSGRAALDDIELEYEISGTGEPVVLIHPGHFADWLGCCWIGGAERIVTAS